MPIGSAAFMQAAQKARKLQAQARAKAKAKRRVKAQAKRGKAHVGGGDRAQFRRVAAPVRRVNHRLLVDARAKQRAVIEFGKCAFRQKHRINIFLGTNVRRSQLSQRKLRILRGQFRNLVKFVRCARDWQARDRAMNAIYALAKANGLRVSWSVSHGNTDSLGLIPIREEKPLTEANIAKSQTLGERINRFVERKVGSDGTVYYEFNKAGFDNSNIRIPVTARYVQNDGDTHPTLFVEYTDPHLDLPMNLVSAPHKP